MGATEEDDVQNSHPQRWITLGALFTMVQSGLLLSGTAVGLSLWTCVPNIFSEDPVWQTVRLFYFSNVDCSSQFLVNGNSYELAGRNSAALRTLIILCFYTVLSSIWFIGSFLLLVSAIRGKHMSPALGSYLHYPWIISMVLILILDIIAAILYCVDLLSTSDLSSVMELLNLKPGGAVQDLQHKSQAPWIMSLLFCKGVLLWVIDIAVMIIMYTQFQRLFLLRQQAKFVRAQMATLPAYLWPPELQKNLSSSNDSPIEPTPSLPRLVNHDGRVVGATSTLASTPNRSSALQMAARQGFSYERPPSSPWNVSHQEGSIPRIPKTTTPQKYGYGSYPQDVTGNWYTGRETLPPRDDRSSNILQRDNDVFY